MKMVFALVSLCILAAMDCWLLWHFNPHFYAAVLVLAFPFFLLFIAFELLDRLFNIKTDTINNRRLLLSSLFIAVILGEVMLRLLHVNPTYYEGVGRCEYQSPYWPDKKNSFWHLYGPNDTIRFSDGEFKYYRTTNHLGLTEREINLLDTSIHKILALGDSFTEGIGTEADSAWPRVLERYLNRCSSDSFLVYNAGVGGSDPVYEYHLLRNSLWNIKWDAVVFCINNTDIGDCSFRGGMERFTNDTVQFAKPPLWEPLYAVSHLARFVVLNIMHYDWTLRSPNKRKEIGIKAVHDITTVLKTANQELANRGIYMLLVTQPMAYDLAQPRYAQSEFDSVLANTQSLKTLDLRPFLRDTIGINETNFTKIYWTHDAHFKGIGYQIIGNKIGSHLAKSLHLPCN